MGTVDLHTGKARCLGNAGHARVVGNGDANVVFSHGAWDGEQPAAAQPDGRRCQRASIGHAGALPARVADLHPELIAGRGPRLSQSGQGVLTAIAVDHDIAGPFQVAVIHHDVTADQRAHAAFAPASIKGVMTRRGLAHRRRQALGHGRFEQTVWQHNAAGQGE